MEKLQRLLDIINVDKDCIIQNRIPLKLILFTSLFLILLIMSFLWLNSKSSRSFRFDLKQSILKELISINTPAPGKKVDVMYLLGGNQTNMEFKSKTASEFFHKGICKKIWLMSLLGITEYSKTLGRNWTQNEYYTMRLKKLGVPEEDIEFIKIDEGFFGTYSEARGVSSLIKEKQYKSVLLIAPPYHTRRVRISFNKFLSGEKVTMYVLSSGERVPLRYLIVEYIKLKIYQIFLI